MVNSERCIYILLVSCRLRIEPTHSTCQAGGNLERSQGSSPGARLWHCRARFPEGWVNGASLGRTNASAPTRDLLNQRAVSAVSVGLGFWGDYYGCCHAITWF